MKSGDLFDDQGQAFLRPFRPKKEGLQWKRGWTAVDRGGVPYKNPIDSGNEEEDGGDETAVLW